ncbi:hypothetical protein [uncultured Ruminococcus sp.]|uniref:hypothetical protein n=1 Tax=uncultured Ruminococcus sp. TaxID=165186 RepID=UPI0025DA70BD|nr:hypothetical protein [uncultured Ruminococcus sp.]
MNLFEYKPPHLFIKSQEYCQMYCRYEGKEHLLEYEDENLSTHEKIVEYIDINTHDLRSIPSAPLGLFKKGLHRVTIRRYSDKTVIDRAYLCHPGHEEYKVSVEVQRFDDNSKNVICVDSEVFIPENEILYFENDGLRYYFPTDPGDPNDKGIVAGVKKMFTTRYMGSSYTYNFNEHPYYIVPEFERDGIQSRVLSQSIENGSSVKLSLDIHVEVKYSNINAQNNQKI